MLFFESCLNLRAGGNAGDARRLDAERAGGVRKASGFKRVTSFLQANQKCAGKHIACAGGIDFRHRKTRNVPFNAVCKYDTTFGTLCHYRDACLVLKTFHYFAITVEVFFTQHEHIDVRQNVRRFFPAAKTHALGFIPLSKPALRRHADKRARKKFGKARIDFACERTEMDNRRFAPCIRNILGLNRIGDGQEKLLAMSIAINIVERRRYRRIDTMNFDTAQNSGDYKIRGEPSNYTRLAPQIACGNAHIRRRAADRKTVWHDILHNVTDDEEINHGNHWTDDRGQETETIILLSSVVGHRFFV